MNRVVLQNTTSRQPRFQKAKIRPRFFSATHFLADQSSVDASSVWDGAASSSSVVEQRTRKRTQDAGCDLSNRGRGRSTIPQAEQSVVHAAVFAPQNDSSRPPPVPLAGVPPREGRPPGSHPPPPEEGPPPQDAHRQPSVPLAAGGLPPGSLVRFFPPHPTMVSHLVHCHTSFHHVTPRSASLTYLWPRISEVSSPLVVSY